MTKRLVDIDDDLLDQTRKLLGAVTMKETVNTSLRELVATELRPRHLRDWLPEKESTWVMNR